MRSIQWQEISLPGQKTTLPVRHLIQVHQLQCPSPGKLRASPGKLFRRGMSDESIIKEL